MPSYSDERTPLLFQFPGSNPQFEELPDAYKQFSHLIGIRPADASPDQPYHPPRDTLYNRALERRKWQGRMYAFSAALTNTLLLSQIVLGAALTGLGASKSSPVLITIFGALNTIIAGVITFLKSRGQPMRARMFRDDLSRVIDEIENSATMWRGISQNAHGYDAIDTDDSVTVRSEVARLTRLYDRAVRTNTMNDPDNYGAGPYGDTGTSGLRSRAGPIAPAVPAAVSTAATAPAAQAPAADPDESPATKTEPPKKDADPPKDESKTTSDAKPTDDKGKQPQPAKSDPSTAAAPDPDVSPATQSEPASGKSEAKPSPGPSSNEQATAGASS